MDWLIKRTMKGIRRTFGVVPRRAKALVKADLLEMLVLVNRQKPVERGARPGVVVDRCCRRLAMTFSRRIFTLTLAATGAAACASDAFAQAQLNEKEPQAWRSATSQIRPGPLRRNPRSTKRPAVQRLRTVAIEADRPEEQPRAVLRQAGQRQGGCSAWAKKA
jgi:hypothetical protein